MYFGITDIYRKQKHRLFLPSARPAILKSYFLLGNEKEEEKKTTPKADNALPALLLQRVSS